MRAAEQRKCGAAAQRGIGMHTRRTMKHLLCLLAHHPIREVAHGRMRVALPMQTVANLADAALHVPPEIRRAGFAQHFDEAKRLELHVGRAFLQACDEGVLHAHTGIGIERQLLKLLLKMSRCRNLVVRRGFGSETVATEPE